MYLKEPIGEQRRLYGELCRAYDFGRPAGLEVRDFMIPGPGGRDSGAAFGPRLTGLPPAAILTAEADPLLADAERYAQVPAAAGVPTDLEVAKGVVHGFLRARHISPESGRAFAWLCDAARRWLDA